MDAYETAAFAVPLHYEIPELDSLLEEHPNALKLFYYNADRDIVVDGPDDPRNRKAEPGDDVDAYGYTGYEDSVDIYLVYPYSADMTIALAHLLRDEMDFLYLPESLHDEWQRDGDGDISLDGVLNRLPNEPWLSDEHTGASVCEDIHGGLDIDIPATAAQKLDEALEGHLNRALMLGYLRDLKAALEKLEAGAQVPAA